MGIKVRQTNGGRVSCKLQKKKSTSNKLSFFFLADNHHSVNNYIYISSQFLYCFFPDGSLLIAASTHHLAGQDRAPAIILV